MFAFTSRPLVKILSAALLAGAVTLSLLQAATAPEPKFPIRIKAGVSTPHTDEAGVVWLADQGFLGGDTIDREQNMRIENTKTPSLYRSERYSMTGFVLRVPNGKYTVKLHFAETFEGVTGVGQRVFSYNVEGKDFKDFDIFKTTGGFARAHVETVEVNITDGQLDISFTSNIENPEINALEIIPAAAEAKK